MLSANELESLIAAQNTEEAIKILTDKGYGLNISGNETIDEILKGELEKAWTEAKNVCPEGAPLDILLYQNDFHNLKTILKASICGVSWEHLVLKPCIQDPEKISEAVKSVNFDDLDEFIRDTAKTAYNLICETNDGQLVEVYLDKKVWRKMLEKSISVKNEFLSGWINLNILIANMKIAVRSYGKSKEFIKNAMIESDELNTDKLIEAALLGKEEVIETISSLGFPEAAELLEKSFSDFEKWCDNKKMEYIKKAKLKSFGFEPILAFLIGKEFELQAVRIILSGKQNNVPTEIIRERLGDLYV